MIYVKFICNTPYCGTESIYYQEFEEEDEKLFDEICEEYARENGESYEHLINGWGEPVDERMTLIGTLMIVTPIAIGKLFQKKNIMMNRGGEKSPPRPREKSKRLQCCNNY